MRVASIAEVTEGCEVEPGASEEAIEEAGPVLHPPEPGLDQRGQLADVALCLRVPRISSAAVTSRVALAAVRP